ncbi:DUF2568 domain-containing protein [Peribacillus saganii]|uniref:DUF2568 domain-containing protein n=1 Tax=Peribacillus saganii TaxID=2303992 RepID=A0A372LNH7_9BACI|nr:DUF2568 domain-containing protein [Peribacillus saganii]
MILLLELCILLSVGSWGFQAHKQEITKLGMELALPS